MTVSVFVDTNILLYSRDASEPQKQPLAESLLRRLWRSRSGRISVQVLNEYFVNVTTKLKPGLTPAEAWDDMEALKAWNPVETDFNLLSKGYMVYQRYQLSWWDALIIAAADTSGCSYLISEDLCAGQVYNGIRVVNPFQEDVTALF